jgi:hypothetical protein
MKLFLYRTPILIIVFLLILLALVSVSCNNHTPEETPITTSEEVQLSPEESQKSVDSINALKPKDNPEQLENPDAVKTSELFDINSYFIVLSHLSMEPGYILDYLHFGDSFFGSRPIIYVRQTDQPPFANYEEYDNATKDNLSADNVYGFVTLIMGGDKTSFDNKIRLDGTSEGYFEYVVLNMIGGQFYLSWHALYDDSRIICDDNSLQKVLSEGDIFNKNSPFPADVLNKTRYLKTDPTVTYIDDKVIVRLTYFTDWGGFVRASFTITRNEPYQIIDIERHTIVEYQCGIQF